MSETDALSAARAGDERAFRELVAPYQRELRAYCYRMAGSLDEADDLLQESLLRAWRGLGGFEGRSSLRTWLYRVASSACLDGLAARPPRSLGLDEPPGDPSAPVPAPRAEGWIGPCPASLYADAAPSPEARYSARESVAFAFLTALQLLPPKQRAIVIARDVLGLSTEECAEVLDTSVASVTSALQRARETLDARARRTRPEIPGEAGTRELLARYVSAWEKADVGALVAILREEATLAMPPIPLWLRGRDAIGQSIGQMVFTPDAAFRLRVIEANGLPAVGGYRRGPDGQFHFASVHALELDGGGVVAITAFLDPRLREAFSLPEIY